MLTIEAVYKLSDSEIELLQSLIGKQIHSIYSDGVGLSLQRSEYTFTGPLNITLFPFDKKYYIFKYAFHENELGEEYYTTDIFASEVPVQINTSDDGHIQLPCATLHFPVAFTIKTIAVYGLEYEFVVQSSCDQRPYWKILSENPNVPVKATISTEHILIFKATDGQKMAICPSSALPWIMVSFQQDFIDKIETGFNAYPFKNYKRKLILD